MQLKFLQEQLTILKNETNNLISVVSFFLGVSVEESDEAKTRELIKIHCSKAINGKFIQFSLDEVSGKFSGFVEEIRKKLEEKGKKFDENKEELVKILYSLYSLRNKLDLYIRQVREIYCKVLEGAFHSIWPTEILIFVSNMISEVNNILISLNVIVKILKFRRENAYQGYIPIPLLHRRYRLYNLHHFIVVSFEKLIEEFLNKNKELFDGTHVRFLASSDYDVGDAVTERIPITLIRGSFFWREQSSFLPILVHEIGHRIYGHLEGSIKRRIEKRIRYLGERKWRGALEYNFERLLNIWEEVFADAIGFMILGDAYIMSLLFAGLWGFKYSELSSEEDGRRYYSFRPNIIATGDILGHEKSILRILFLANLRKKFKRKKELSKWLLISPEVNEYLDGVIEAINDLYPVLSKNGYAFSTLSFEEKKRVLIKASLLKGLAFDFTDIFDFADDSKIEKLRKKFVGGKSIFQFNVGLKSSFLDVEWAEGCQKGEDGKRLFLKVGESNFLSLSAPSEKEFWIEIPKSIPGNLDFKKGNLYGLMWFCNMEILRTKMKEDIFEWSFWEGRIFRSYYLLKRFPFLLNELGEEKGIKLKLGEVVCLKCRGIYDRSGKNVINEIERFLREFSIENEEEEGKKKNLRQLFLTLGAFDFMFFWEDYETAKKDEDRFYRELQKRLAFADRHSVLFIERDGRNENFNDGNLKFVVLVKVKVPTSEDGVVEVMLGDMKSHLFAISSGWETLVFTPDTKSLRDFFCEFMIEKLLPQGWAKRPETIIGIPLKSLRKSENGKDVEKREEKLRLAVSLRLDIEKEDKEDKREIFRELLKEGWGLFAGRFDVVYVKGLSSEEEIPCEIVRVLERESLQRISIKDMRIDVIFKENYPERRENGSKKDVEN